jgi:hypothetical protein
VTTNAVTLAIHVRFVVNGVEMPAWRFRAFLWCIRLLSIPAAFELQSQPPVIVMQGSGSVQ